ncbi:6-O-methylguanine DNA methyltransferase [Aspergillus aurantiobrunneus]
MPLPDANDPPSGPHDLSLSDRDPGFHSPQPLHKESDHDATDPVDTTSPLFLASHHPQAAGPEPEPGPGPNPGTKMQTHNNQRTIKAAVRDTTKESTARNGSSSFSADLNPSAKLTKKILHHPTLTPLRKSLYILLLSVPAGRWTTYAALAKRTGSSARAVGTAMRLNPFAPDVPCHRVLSVDGGLGGYMGTPPGSHARSSSNLRGSRSGTGSSGQANLERKRRILEGEGVRFDERGRAMGKVFVEFTETV